LPNQTVLIAGTVMLFGIGQYWYRYNIARGVAQAWLQEHHYRAVEFGLLWFHGIAFAPRLDMYWHRPFVFKAVVNDSELGGTGVVWLRVWTPFIGVVDDDVDVVWKEMPHGEADGGAQPLGNRMEDAQLGLIHRIASGETSFYAPRQREGGNASLEYDEMVEHLLALSRRGMITCKEPDSGIKGWTQYSDVTNVALTDEGRKLASRNA
jgi:hypothetical protein